MKMPGRNEYADERGGLPADVAAIGAALEALAAADRAGAAPGLEARVVLASRAAFTPPAREVAPVAARVDRLAAEEQASARAGLEEQSFELSREAVASGRFVEGGAEGLPSVVARRNEGDGRGRARAHRRRLVWGLRAAAVAVIVGSGALVWMRPAAPTSVIVARVDAADLARQLSREMDTLLEVVGDSEREASHEVSSPDAEPDPAWVEDLLSKESL